jgi:Tol biopolymer transport system component
MEKAAFQLKHALLRRRMAFGAAVGLCAAILITAGLLAGSSPETPERAAAPQVIYLAPADSPISNLYLHDLDGGDPRPLTDAAEGVEDFAVSPDKRQIAYTQNNADGTADIWLLDLDNGDIRALTRCVQAFCSDPAWNPDSTQVLYQREEFGGDQGEISWTWIVDVNTVQTRLLFDDPQVRGADPIWSPDGRRVAVFDAQINAIRVRKLDTGIEVIINSSVGASGAFSPDGTRLIFPVLVRGAMGDEFYTHLEMVNFETQSGESISGEPDAPIDDAFAAWSPDGARLALARRYFDSRYTAGKQIYWLDLATGEVTPLVVDPTYNHAGMQWDETGRQIVFQRFSLVTPNARPEVWVYDLESGALTPIAENAFLPAWR